MGKDNPADMFTKPLSFVPFYKHCEEIGMRALPKTIEGYEKLRNKKMNYCHCS